MQIFIKGVGVLLLLASGFFVGNYFAKKLVQNTLIIKDTILILKHLENNLMFKKDNLLQALNQANTACQLDVFFMPSNIENYIKIKDILLQNQIYYSKKQYNVLCEIFDNLGSSIGCIETQKLAYYINYFETEKQIAIKTEEKNAKLYRTLGLYIGASIAIFIV